MTHTTLFDYLSGLELTQGAGVGDPFPVLPWQKKFLAGAFSEDVFEASLSIARGNGKSTLVAAIAAACLDGPLVEPRAEIVVCASSHEQGRIVFDHVGAFLNVLEHKKKYRVWDSVNVAQIRNRDNGVTLKCIGSDPRRAHGLAPVLVICDEPAQWPPNTGDKMIAALRTALGKIPGSRLIALGTRADSDEHWFEKMLTGDADFAMSYQAHPDLPPFRKSTWLKANPSLRYMPHLEKVLRREAGRAKRDPQQLAAFRALRLNQGTPDVVTSMLVEAAAWKRAEFAGTLEEAGRYALGIDLGATAAMSAAAAFWPDSGALEAVAAFPSEPSLAERGLADGVGNMYQKMQDRDELILAGQFTSSVSGLLGEVLRRWGRPGVIVADRWREGELREALKAADFPLTHLVLRGNGYKDGSEDVREFKRALDDGLVRPEVSLLLRAAMSEARLAHDPQGNAKLAKGNQAGRRWRGKDDAAAAAILAVAEGMRRSKRSGSGRRARVVMVS